VAGIAGEAFGLRLGGLYPAAQIGVQPDQVVKAGCFGWASNACGMPRNVGAGGDSSLVALAP
jgi:hypothetical protein